MSERTVTSMSLMYWFNSGWTHIWTGTLYFRRRSNRTREQKKLTRKSLYLFCHGLYLTRWVDLSSVKDEMKSNFQKLAQHTGGNWTRNNLENWPFIHKFMRARDNFVSYLHPHSLLPVIQLLLPPSHSCRRSSSCSCTYLELSVYRYIYCPTIIYSNWRPIPIQSERCVAQ